ncbi:MAG: hypothetical protein WCG08_02900 [Paludibacter sp.]|jgi:hypothetical protein
MKLFTFSKLNAYLFAKRADLYLSTLVREPRFVTYDKARTILILFESDYSEKNFAIRKIINSLQADAKKVSAWGYIDKKLINTAIFPDFRILNNDQTDFFRKPLISYLNELENNEYDLLIDLTLRPLIPMQYIAMYAKTAFKTAIHKSDQDIFDFVLDVESLMTPAEKTENDEPAEILVDETYVFNQIIFYLKSIQSKD